MSDVEALKKGAFNSNYTYLKILQKYRFTTNEIHYVFEGKEDHSFYFNYLAYLNPNYHTYMSYGKKQSIELYHKIDWQKYEKRRIAIFIDRDYSRILGESIPSDANIYETTFYSIENYIAMEVMLRRMIAEILHFHEDDQIGPIIHLYRQQMDLFLERIKPIIAWILIIRSHNLKANLNSINLKHIFSVDLNLILSERRINKISYLETVTQTTTPKVPLSVFRDWYLVMSKQESHKFYLRGKFEMWFFITFFNSINSYLKTKFGHESNQKTYITPANAVEILGPRTPQPVRLSQFLTYFKP